MTTHQNTQLTRQRLLASLVLFTSGAIEGIYGRGSSLRARLVAIWSGLLDSADMLAGERVLHMEGDAPAEGEKQGLTILGLSGITLVIVGCLVLAICVLPVCVIIMLTLLGPAIGNVFSEIESGI